MGKKFKSFQLVLFVLILTTFQFCSRDRHQFWSGNIFHQETVDASQLERGLIRAKVDGKWQEFKVRELPEKFLKWNFERRIETIEKIRKGEMPSLAGPHNAMVASHGLRRYDTRFTINNAVKGMGFLPSKEKLQEIIKLLESTASEPFPRKLAILDSLYRNADDIFDKTKQISLELYSTPSFETHTFLNEMFNPGVAVVFLDIPCFEIKAVAHLLHPDDPGLSPYERDVVKYANLIHSYFHGEFPKMFIAVIYYVIEVYDNSPGKGGKGVRIVPPFP